MDEEDYAHVLSGSNDLAGCVLKGAEFIGIQLRGRNFSNAKLEGASFQGSDLEGSTFRGASVNMVNFSQANLRKTQFNGGNVSLDFRGADLSEARLEGVYLNVDFREANLSGANFSGAHLNDGCQFEGAIVTEGTLFDGAHVLRPYSRLPTFRYYRLERGVLHRISEDALAEDLDRLRLDSIDSLTGGIQLLRRISVKSDAQSEQVGIGHNSPPEEFQLSPEEIQAADAVFTEARDALQVKERDPSKYLHAIETAKILAKKAAIWSGQKVDTAVSEFATEFGKTLGGRAALIVGALHFTGALERIVHTLTQYLDIVLSAIP